MYLIMSYMYLVVVKKGLNLKINAMKKVKYGSFYARVL